MLVAALQGVSSLLPSGLAASTPTAARTNLRKVSEDIDAEGRIAPSITPVSVLRRSRCAASQASSAQHLCGELIDDLLAGGDGAIKHPIAPGHRREERLHAVVSEA
jgi:hypothetical protein